MVIDCLGSRPMISMHSRYFIPKNRPLMHPMHSFPDLSGPDPTAGSWSSSCGIDEPFLDPSTLIDEFPLDIPNEITGDGAEEFLPEPLLSPADLHGLGVSCHPSAAGVSHGSTSSDPESDDEPWSPSHMAAYHISQTNSPPEPHCAGFPQIPQSRDRSNRWPFTPEAVQYHPLGHPSTPNHASATNMAVDNDTGTDAAQTPTPPGQRTNKRAAHNVIEKRYRTNMNAKFDALERAMGGRIERKRSTTGEAGTSLKKSEILSKALTYIHGLQEENRALRDELGLLRQNLIRLAGCM
ncbi:hypothetical protein BJY04DRAFT_150228 [Aspergillus karnatakaensis]|uniref:basic helix-loop-helix domain-containing protein n=1 Tax=Aspergillus karnatakaensis TaxID=1810916 RepID=UPI003CCCF1BB